MLVFVLRQSISWDRSGEQGIPALAREWEAMESRKRRGGQSDGGSLMRWHLR